jgi:hypothetical protein
VPGFTAQPGIARVGHFQPGRVAPLLPASLPFGSPRVELAVPSWTDITSYVYQRDTVQIRRGRQNEASTMQPGSASMTLNNRDARFTTRNPTGAYWPNLVQNTPLRMSVAAADIGLPKYLRFETDSSSSVSSAGGTAITSSIDMRLDVQLTGWQALGATTGLLGVVTGLAGMLVSRWTSAGNERSWAWYLNDDGTMTFRWSPDGTHSNDVALTSTVPIPQQPGRIVLRVTMAVGATSVVTFYTAAAGNADTGPFTQLGQPVTTTATSIFNSTAQVLIGADPNFTDMFVTSKAGFFGNVYEYELRSGVGGTVTAHPVFTAQPAGVTSFADTQGNTWTLNGTSELSDRQYRFHGELSTVPKAADPSAKDVYSQAQALGVSARMGNSNTPLNSPMRRYYVRLRSSLNLAAYWPCEDGTSALSIGSGIGGTPLSILGSPQLASNSQFAGSLPIPNLNNGTFLGNVPPSTAITWTDNVVRAIVAVPSGGDTNGAIWLQAAYQGGTVAAAALVYGTGGSLTMNAYNGGGGLIHSLASGPGFVTNGGLYAISMTIQANGSSVNMLFEEMQVGQASSTGNSFTLAASSVGVVTRVQVGSLSGTSTAAIGHVAVQGVWDNVQDLLGPLNGWAGETAGARIARLCGEEGIGARIVGSPGQTMPMGTQPIDTLMSVLQQCEQTDLGMLFEPRQCLGVGYRTRSSMYHQTPACTASYSAAAIFQGFGSSADTQLTVNDVTATAPSGSTARAFLSTGPMSINSPPSGIGRIDTQISPNPQLDTSLNQLAAWHLSVRSVDDDRYPAIPFVMNRSETPLTAALLDIGDYLQVTNTPSWLPPGPVRQLAAGFAETYAPTPLWQLNVNGIPELPYETAQAGTTAANSAHADTAGAQLTAAITAAATSFQVTTTAGPVWTQAAGDMPFDIVIDREQITVTAVSGATSPQTFTVTRSVNGVTRTHAAGAAVALYRKPIISL